MQFSPMKICMGKCSPPNNPQLRLFISYSFILFEYGLLTFLHHQSSYLNRDGFMKKDDAWFQYYYDVVGYPHADDEKGTTREISPHLKWRFGVKSQADAFSSIKHKVLVFLLFGNMAF